MYTVPHVTSESKGVWWYETRHSQTVQLLEYANAEGIC